MSGNYPEGMQGSRRTAIELQCKGCGHKWEADCVYDLGDYRLCNERASLCPICGKEGE